MSDMHVVRRGSSSQPLTYDFNHVAVWKLDEESGNTVNDFTGGVFQGTAGSGATIVDGWKNKGRSLDGTVNGNISFNNEVIPLGAKTIRFKIKRLNISWGGNIIDNGANNNNHGITISSGGTGIIRVLSHRGISGAQRINLNSNYAIPFNIWHDVQFTWDGTTNTNMAKIYIKILEGANAGKWIDSSGAWVDSIAYNVQGTATHEEVTNATFNLIIGKQANANAQYLSAILDEIEISNISRIDMLDYK